jgi:aryl-alcohol dehydrogenase-like predicted oxidoreductase
VLDLYYLHRVDPDVPVEESFGTLSELVHEGKIRRLGISECTVGEIARAHATHPVSRAPERVLAVDARAARRA